MKTSILVLLLLAVGCSTPKTGKVTVRPLPAGTVSEGLAVRYPEAVAAYHVGRYADPNQRLLMHEAHTIYRVEGLATWNFHAPPGLFILPTGAEARTNPAYLPPPVNDAAAAEFNRQRAITRTVTEQAGSLNNSLREFTSALANTRSLVEENKALHEQISRDERRLDALEAELKKNSSHPSFSEDNISFEKTLPRARDASK